MSFRGAPRPHETDREIFFSTFRELGGGKSQGQIPKDIKDCKDRKDKERRSQLSFLVLAVLAVLAVLDVLAQASRPRGVLPGRGRPAGRRGARRLVPHRGRPRPDGDGSSSDTGPGPSTAPVGAGPGWARCLPC